MNLNTDHEHEARLTDIADVEIAVRGEVGGLDIELAAGSVP